MKTDTVELPKPDTHCIDEDTGKDVWSHSPEQMREYAAQVAAAENYGLLSLLYDIRVAAGDKGGKLMQDELVASIAALRADSERLNYIERTFSGMTCRERYLPVTMIWGKGCNGRTIREACDKYMKRDAN